MDYIAREVKACGKISHFVRIKSHSFFFGKKILFAISERSLKACIKEPAEKTAVFSCFSSLLQLPA